VSYFRDSARRNTVGRATLLRVQEGTFGAAFIALGIRFLGSEAG